MHVCYRIRMLFPPTKHLNVTIQWVIVLISQMGSGTFWIAQDEHKSASEIAKEPEQWCHCGEISVGQVNFFFFWEKPKPLSNGLVTSSSQAVCVFLWFGGRNGMGFSSWAVLTGFSQFPPKWPTVPLMLWRHEQCFYYYFFSFMKMKSVCC